MFNVDTSRLLRVTASMAPWLVSGDEDIIQQMFLRITSDPRYVDDGFSRKWRARYGLCVEPLALEYYAEQKQIQFIDQQKQYVHPTRDWVSAKPDGRLMPGNILTDVKCINAMSSYEDRARFYLPQMIVQQECCLGDGIALLFVKGGEDPVYWQYDEIDPGYRAAVWDRLEMFWRAVESLTPPFPFRFKAIYPPEKWRTVDLDDETTAPNWADDMRELLRLWAETHESFKAHEKSKEGVKALIPDDVGTIIADKYTVKRNRRNAITVAHRKDER